MTAIAILRNAPGSSNQRGRGPNKNSNYFKVLITFLFGILFGRFGQPDCSTTTNNPAVASSSSSSIASKEIQSSIKYLKDIPARKTAHTDRNTGNAITKQQFLEPFLVPNVAGFSVATIQRNQTVEMHSHRSMHEFFYVLEGSATFFMNGYGDGKGDGKGHEHEHEHGHGHE